MKNGFRFGCRYLAILLAFIFVGCSEKPKAAHSHLWVGDQEFNVWSYERVETFLQNGEETIGEFIVSELHAGDVATFASGASVKFDGTELMIDDILIDQKNVQLESDGSIRMNAFIKVD